jgi:hypothetical protein
MAEVAVKTAVADLLVNDDRVGERADRQPKILGAAARTMASTP